MADLLIELFSEEIPARMQARAADDLKKAMTDGMVEAGLTYAAAAAFAKGFSTSRKVIKQTGRFRFCASRACGCISSRAS